MRDDESYTHIPQKLCYCYNIVSWNNKWADMIHTHSKSSYSLFLGQLHRQTARHYLGIIQLCKFLPLLRCQSLPLPPHINICYPLSLSRHTVLHSTSHHSAFKTNTSLWEYCDDGIMVRNRFLQTMQRNTSHITYQRVSLFPGLVWRNQLSSNLRNNGFSPCNRHSFNFLLHDCTNSNTVIL